MDGYIITTFTYFESMALVRYRTRKIEKGKRVRKIIPASEENGMESQKKLDFYEI